MIFPDRLIFPVRLIFFVARDLFVPEVDIVRYPTFVAQTLLNSWLLSQDPAIGLFRCTTPLSYVPTLPVARK